MIVVTCVHGKHHVDLVLLFIVAIADTVLPQLPKVDELPVNTGVTKAIIRAFCRCPACLPVWSFDSRLVCIGDPLPFVGC